MPRLVEIGEYADGTPIYVEVPTLAEYLKTKEVYR